MVYRLFFCKKHCHNIGLVLKRDNTEIISECLCLQKTEGDLNNSFSQGEQLKNLLTVFKSSWSTVGLLLAI